LLGQRPSVLSGCRRCSVDRCLRQQPYGHRVGRGARGAAGFIAGALREIASARGSGARTAADRRQVLQLIADNLRSPGRGAHDRDRRVARSAMSSTSPALEGGTSPRRSRPFEPPRAPWKRSLLGIQANAAAGCPLCAGGSIRTCRSACAVRAQALARILASLAATRSRPKRPRRYGSPLTRYPAMRAGSGCVSSLIPRARAGAGLDASGRHACFAAGPAPGRVDGWRVRHRSRIGPAHPPGDDAALAIEEGAAERSSISASAGADRLEDEHSSASWRSRLRR